MYMVIMGCHTTRLSGLVGKSIHHLESECCGFESCPRQLIFLRKMANSVVLLCLSVVLCCLSVSVMS